MKFTVILVLCVSTFVLNAQKMTQVEAIGFAEKLYQIDILSEKGRQVLVEKIRASNSEIWDWITINDSTFVKGDSIRCTNILSFCGKAFERERIYRLRGEGTNIESLISYEDPFPEGFSFFMSDIMIGGNKENYEPLISPKRSVLGKTRTRTLNDLFKIGLINKMAFDLLLPMIKSNLIYSEFQIFNYFDRGE